MEKSEEISDALVSILQTVPGIGRVYKQIPYARTEEEFKNDFTDVERRINVVGFTTFTRTVIKDAEAFAQEEILRLFVFVLYLGFNFDENSDTTARELSDKICNIVNLNQDLNGTVSTHSKLDQTSNNLGRFFNTLCHILSFEMTTTEEEINE